MALRNAAIYRPARVAIETCTPGPMPKEEVRGASPAPRMIRTVSAVIADARGRMLLVRKRGSDFLIQPGGKREPGESDIEALSRELVEELGVRFVAGSEEFLGEFEDVAVHEPGTTVRTHSYVVAIEGEPAARAEIAELVWVDEAVATSWNIAPLSQRHVMPAFRSWWQQRRDEEGVDRRSPT